MRFTAGRSYDNTRLAADEAAAVLVFGAITARSPLISEGRGHQSSTTVITTLPTLCPLSTYRWASTISAIG
jgi:hypothetical protein